MTLFNSNDPASQIDPNKDYFEELVGEGKKYADAKQAGKALVHKDLHIQRLETEHEGMRNDMLRMREELNAVPKLQELIEKLGTNSNNEQNLENVNQNTEKTAVDMQEVESLFAKKYDERKAQEQAEQNYNVSLSKLKSVHGDNYESTLKTQMDELGVTEEFVNNLARTNPNAFAKMFAQAAPRETFQAPPQSNRRSDSFAPSGAQKRDEAYYENLRQTKPDLYWSPKTQNQMHMDADKLGDAFFVD